MPENAPHILSIGTANPDLYLTQQDVYDFYRSHDLIPEGQKALYDRLLLDSPIKGRYFGLDDPIEIINETPDSQIRRYSHQATKTASQACRSAIANAKLTPKDIGGIVVSTCTGYLCPGLTSYLVDELGLNNDIHAMDIMGMGCGSALPNLECGWGMYARKRNKPVMCVAVEICSATHMIDDDPGLTVSNCIFGDGAAAAIVGNNSGYASGIRMEDFETGIFPEHREALRYNNDRGHLRNTLTNRVPAVGSRCLETVTCKLLKRNGLVMSDIQWWAVHAGGTQVLDSVAKRFDISPAKLATSYEIFKNYGNMSSPTVLFVLNDLIQRGLTVGTGLILAFGAGFSAFAALVFGE